MFMLGKCLVSATYVLCLCYVCAYQNGTITGPRPKENLRRAQAHYSTFLAA